MKLYDKVTRFCYFGAKWGIYLSAEGLIKLCTNVALTECNSEGESMSAINDSKKASGTDFPQNNWRQFNSVLVSVNNAQQTGRSEWAG
jgi:hypothetical protein